MFLFFFFQKFIDILCFENCQFIHYSIYWLGWVVGLIYLMTSLCILVTNSDTCGVRKSFLPSSKLSLFFLIFFAAHRYFFIYLLYFFDLIGHQLKLEYFNWDLSLNLNIFFKWVFKITLVSNIFLSIIVLFLFGYVFFYDSHPSSTLPFYPLPWYPC